MPSNRIQFLLPGLLLAMGATATELENTIRTRSQRVVVDQATAVEQAQARAQSSTEFGMELRPRVSNNDVGVALRIYMPDQWNKSKLQEQLVLLAESEQLRVSALEWQELIQVYRKFCDYRMLQNQQTLFEKELRFLEPYLEQADLSVQQNQLTVTDRARLYSLYLDLMNNQGKTKSNQLKTEEELRLLLGVNADLDRMAPNAQVAMPPKTEFDSLLVQALANRPDYQQFEVQARALSAAEEVVGGKNGFRLKYIQPAYDLDHEKGESSVGLSASFILPWGTKNTDVAVYQQQRALTYSSMNLQRSVIEHRLRVMLKSAEAYYEQADRRDEKTEPILARLTEDLNLMNTGRLEDVRDLMQIRERILDVTLETTRTTCRKEQLAVELAEELGSLSQ